MFETCRTPRGVRGLKYSTKDFRAVGNEVAPLAGCVD